MLGLSRTLAQEWEPHNIQVNVISPGPVHGERMSRVVRQRAERSGRSIPEVEHEYTAPLALGRFVEPFHVAATAVFLACEESDSITRETIQVASGYHLG